MREKENDKEDLVKVKSIKELREKLNLTQKELAYLINVRQCSISQWETGRWDISMKNFKKIIDFAKKHGYCISL